MSDCIQASADDSDNAVVDCGLGVFLPQEQIGQLRRELEASRQNWKIPPKFFRINQELDTWNLFTLNNKEPIKHIKYWLERQIYRGQLSDLSGAELKVRLLIYDRTIPFNKVAEVISLPVFTRGMRDRETQELLWDENGNMPICGGTGLSESAVRSAITRLEEKDLLERVPVYRHGRLTAAYLPAPRPMMRAVLWKFGMPAPEP